jgi:hypothetical protein
MTEFKPGEIGLAANITISHLLQTLSAKGVLSKEECLDVLKSAYKELDSSEGDMAKGAAVFLRGMYSDQPQ